MITGRWTRGMLSVLVLAALVAAPLSGFRVAAPHRAHNAAKVSQLVVADDISDAKSLDPGRLYEFTGIVVARALYDTLVTYVGSDVAHLQPDLATSWSVSGGGAVFTFKLRSGVKFASGNLLTADDVVFSYRRLRYLNDNPEFLIDGLKEIKALDPRTVQITLKAPDVSFLAAMSSPNFAILDSKLVRAQGGSDATDAAKTDKATTYLNANSAGTGAYILKEWTRNTRIVLERNPNYWGAPAPSQQVVLNYVASPETQKLELQKGDADIALNLTSDQIATLKGAPDVTIVSSHTIDYAYLAMNVSRQISQPLSNPLVRQAIRYAIDYEGISGKLLGGNGVQPASIIPVGLVGNNAQNNESLRIRTDRAKARALLAQAGYAKGFVVKLTYGAGFTFDGVSFDTLAAKIINDLKAVGISVVHRGEQFSVALADYRAKHQEMILMPWGADYPDAYDFALYFGPGGGVGKRVNYLQDGDLASLIARADATADVGARAALYRTVQERLLKTGPYAILVQPNYQIGLRSNVKGFAYSPVFRVDLGKVGK